MLERLQTPLGPFIVSRHTFVFSSASFASFSTFLLFFLLPDKWNLMKLYSPPQIPPPFPALFFHSLYFT